jgi:hypothetical protein
VLVVQLDSGKLFTAFQRRTPLPPSTTRRATKCTLPIAMPVR